jgi:DNA adenine methylase
MVKKSLLTWIGGKFYLLKYLNKLLNTKHRIYVEAFGGAGHLLFYKQKSEIEVYNDIDKRLVNFFRVIKNENDFKKFKEIIQNYKFSKKSFIEAKENINKTNDKIKQAIYFFILNRLSYAGNCKTYSKSLDKRKSYKNIIKFYLDYAHNRLKDVIIENLDFKDCILKYDSKDTLFFIDPPYLESRGLYDYELTIERHLELLKLVKSCKAKVILCSDDNELYKKELKDWNKKIIKNYLFMVKAKKRKRRLDIIYYNYEI